MTAQNIISAAELLLREKCAAAADENGYIWKSPSFIEAEKSLGEKRLSDAVFNESPVIIDGSFFYYTDISYSVADGVKYKIITLKKNDIFSPQLLSSEAFRSAAGCIRSAATGIALSLDEIDNAAENNDRVYIRHHLDNIDRLLTLLYSEVIVPGELSLYSSTVRAERTDIRKLIHDSCTGLSAASGGRLDLIMDGTEDIYADIRPDTLRIIISDFAARANRSGDVRYLRVVTEHSEGKLRFSIHAGGPNIKEKPVTLLDDSYYIPNTDDCGASSALAEAFCKQFGGKYFRRHSEGYHILGMVLPDSTSSAVETPQQKLAASISEAANSPRNRFSPENALSAFKYKPHRYSEEI